MGILTGRRRAIEGQIDEHNEERDDEASECHRSDVNEWYCCECGQWLVELVGVRCWVRMKVREEREFEVLTFFTEEDEVMLKQSLRVLVAHRNLLVTCGSGHDLKGRGRSEW